MAPSSQSARALKNEINACGSSSFPPPSLPPWVRIICWMTAGPGCRAALPGASPRQHQGRAHLATPKMPHGIPPPSREPGAFRNNSPHLFPALPQGQITRLRGAWAFVLICISATEVGQDPRQCRFQFDIHLLNNLQNKFKQWVRYRCIEMYHFCHEKIRTDSEHTHILKPYPGQQSPVSFRCMTETVWLWIL